MLFPRSLPPTVISRAFRATNGELGIAPADASAFLDACQADLHEILGWELWLIDHVWDPASNKPEKSPGHWSGLIPVYGESRPNVVHGESDLVATRALLAKLDLNTIVDPQWADYVRVNFTLAQN